MKDGFKVFLKLIKKFFIEEVIDFFTNPLGRNNLDSLEHTEMVRYKSLRLVQECCYFTNTHPPYCLTVAIFTSTNLSRIIVSISQKTKNFNSIVLSTNLKNIYKALQVF